MNLQHLRKQIDEIDYNVLELLTKRFNVAKEVALYKKEYELPVEDKEREKELILDRIETFKDLNPKFIEELFELILKKSKEIQKES